ncbi:MAG: FeoA family protein [Acutalibacteraceae bacterium]
MTKTLNKFEVGEVGVICGVAGEGKIRRRLFDMGVTPGAEVVLRKKAPLGDPYEISIRGYELTLRKAEAACVMLEVNGND